MTVAYRLEQAAPDFVGIDAQWASEHGQGLSRLVASSDRLGEPGLVEPSIPLSAVPRSLLPSAPRRSPLRVHAGCHRLGIVAQFVLLLSPRGGHAADGGDGHPDATSRLTATSASWASASGVDKGLIAVLLFPLRRLIRALIQSPHRVSVMLRSASVSPCPAMKSIGLP